MWGWGIILRASQELGAALMVNKVILVKAEQESDFSIDKSKQKKKTVLILKINSVVV